MEYIHVSKVYNIIIHIHNNFDLVHYYNGFIVSLIYKFIYALIAMLCNITNFGLIKSIDWRLVLLH